jgi:hypothetical protein
VGAGRSPLRTRRLNVPGVLAQPPQAPTFKSGTQVVSLFVTVADAQRRLVPGLTKEDFEVFDNEKPQRSSTSTTRPPINVSSCSTRAAA